MPHAPLLSAPSPGVVQEAVSEQEPALLHGTLSLKVQDFALVLVEFHQVSGCPALEHFDASSQFGVVCKCDGSVLDCFFDSVMKTLKRTGPRTAPCGSPLATR